MKFAHGFAFPDTDRFMVEQISDHGTYQAEQLAEGLRHVTDFGCAVDGGAHAGTWSRTLAGRFARVVAFEPSADTFECLEQNMRAFECANVECHRAALGARAGFVEMALDPENAKRANTGARHVQPGGGSIPVMTLDSLELEHVGFIKLDVEGSEPWAIDGAAETITRCRPVILYENKWLWARHFGLAKDAVASRLRAFGYQELARVSRDAIWGPR
jgi:FkbM family methyltransferase